MKKPVTLIALVATLLLALSSIATASELCPDGVDGWEAKINTTGDPETVDYTAPDGLLVVETCVKAGAATQYVTYDPAEKSVVLDHTEKDSVSHWSVRLVEEDPDPDPTPSPPTTEPTPDPGVEPEASLIPFCAEGGESVVLDMLIETEGRYTLALDGTTINEFTVTGSLPLASSVEDLPLAGNLSLYYEGPPLLELFTGDDPVPTTFVAGGDYANDCAALNPDPVEPEVSVPAVDPAPPAPSGGVAAGAGGTAGELPRAGAAALATGLAALLLLGSGALTLIRFRKR